MRNDVWKKIKIATYYFIKCVRTLVALALVRVLVVSSSQIWI